MNIDTVGRAIDTYSNGLWLERYALLLVGLLVLVWMLIAFKIIAQRRYHPSKKLFVFHTECILTDSVAGIIVGTGKLT